MAKVEKESISEAYNEVRDDSSQTSWAILKYEGTSIVLESTGSDYQQFKESFNDEDRKYGFVRMVTGDELSKRAKFVFITWCGKDVSPLKKARMSVDKSAVKDVINSFAVELLASEPEDIDEDNIRTLVKKAGGANYGTGN
ncbi:hypothetical protein SNE40_008583 [Patella caerulea]|uniref:Coactosin-like protein n=1 Tax=Patella caerulea TaxID=87958 RepID=A0AAN8PZ84_PATCE